MKKLITAILLAFTLIACNKSEPITNDEAKITYKTTSYGFILEQSYSKEHTYRIFYNDQVTVHVKLPGKDEIYITDYDYKKDNGIDVFQNQNKDLKCYKNKPKPKKVKNMALSNVPYFKKNKSNYDTSHYKLCSPEILTFSNKMFKKVLKRLHFDAYLKDNSFVKDNHYYLGGWM